jgi:hypothetical protein
MLYNPMTCSAEVAVSLNDCAAAAAAQKMGLSMRLYLKTER